MPPLPSTSFDQTNPEHWLILGVILLGTGLGLLSLWLLGLSFFGIRGIIRFIFAPRKRQPSSARKN